MKQEEGFRLIINRGLLDQVGDIEVDYLSGPVRRGFQVRTASQRGSC